MVVKLNNGAVREVKKAEQWLKNGAQPTETAKSVLKQSGIIK